MLRDIYERRFVSSTKRKKLSDKKLEKKAFKIYNIKALWQLNRELGLNFQAHTPGSELAEHLKLATGEKINSAHLFSDVT